MIQRTLSLLLIIFLFGASSVFAKPAFFYYSEGPWKGKVIDKETREPIEGAVVLAVWLKYYLGDGSYFFDAVEVLTDKEGNFFIPRFRALNIIPVIRYIDGPKFTVYKPGYPVFPAVGAQDFEKYFSKELQVDEDALSEMFKKGVVIEMPRLKTREERLDAQSSALPTQVPDKKMMSLLNLINTERKGLGLDPTHVIRGNKK